MPLTFYRILFQIGQTHFKNLTAFAARFLKCVCVSDHFGTICSKGINFFLIAHMISVQEGSGNCFVRKILTEEWIFSSSVD